MEFTEKNALPPGYTEHQAKKSAEAQNLLPNTPYRNRNGQPEQVKIEGMEELEEQFKNYRLRKLLGLNHDKDYSILMRHIDKAGYRNIKLPLKNDFGFR